MAVERRPVGRAPVEPHELGRACSGRPASPPINLHVRPLGVPTTREGTPFVLLHGLGVAGSVWSAFARRQLSDRTVIAPDLRGHGESPRSPDGAYDVTDYAADVAGVIASRFAGGPVALVGHSLGGLVAIEVARAASHLVGHLVLLDPPLDPSHSREVVATVARLREAPSPALEEYVGGFHGVAAGAALGRLFRAADAGTFTSYLATPPGAARAWLAAAFVIVPTLLVQADVNVDGALRDEVADEFIRRLPRGQVVRIPGGAHAVHASHPSETGAAIRALVDRSGQ